jgi:hypothetical protein
LNEVVGIHLVESDSWFRFPFSRFDEEPTPVLELDLAEIATQFVELGARLGLERKTVTNLP